MSGRRGLAGVLLAFVSGCVPAPRAVEPIATGFQDCAHPEWPRAEAAAAAGDTSTALQLLPGIAAACPRAVPVHRLWQDLARRAGGDDEAAMRRYYATVEEAPPVAPYLQSRLETSSARRLDLLRASLDADPGFVYALVDVAEVWTADGNPENAVPFLERAVRVAPDFVPARLALARVLEELARYAEAAAQYQVVVDAGGADRRVRLDYAELLIYRLERPDAARPLVDRLLDADPKDVAARMHAAALAWLSGDRDTAADGYRRVLRVDPTNARAALNLGNLYFGGPDVDRPGVRSDWERARRAFRYFLSLPVSQDVHDLHDARVAVPERLARIAELLGPATGPVPPATSL